MKISPCPFCGSTNTKIITDYTEDGGIPFAYHVRCNSCYANGGNLYPGCWCESSEQAIDRWNQRSLQDVNIQHRVIEAEIHYFGELVGITSVDGELVREFIAHLKLGDTIRVYRKPED